MKKEIKLIAMIVGLIVLIAGASILYNELSAGLEIDSITNEDEKKENKAPDFTVVDDLGNKVKLSDFTGKGVVVNFWASWCGPCKSEMPTFDEAYGEYGDDIHFLMVNMTDGDRETVEVAKAFIASSGYSFPVYYDTALDAATTYSVYSIPTTYFVDSSGNLVASAKGAINRETLQKGIDMIKE